MATLQEILARAQALREETELGSISPERAGSIMYDTLQQINQMQLLGASLVINKIYASVAAMEADSAPVSDLSGTALKEGQLVVIVPSDTSSSDMGSVYRFDGIEDSASTWSFTGKIGGYPMDETPTEGSTRAVTSGGVYSAVSQLAQDVTEQINDATLNSSRTVNLLNVKGVVWGKYINNSGNIANGAGWAITPYIPVTAGQDYIISRRVSVRDNGLAWFDSNKEKISGGALNIYNTVRTAPTGAAYMVFNIGYGGALSQDVCVVQGSTAADFVPYRQILTQDIADFEQGVEAIAGVSDDVLQITKAGNKLTLSKGANYIETVLEKNFGDTYSANPVFDFTKTVINGVTITNTDDIAPAHIMGNTYGGNHAQPAYKATVTGHGLDNTAIGTEWVDSNSKKFYIMRIVDANTLFFLSQNNGTAANPSFTALTTGTLTKGASTLSVTAVSSNMLFPGIQNHAISVKMQGGLLITADGVYKSKAVEVLESYEITSPDSILQNIIARAGQSSDPDFSGTAVGRVTNVYRFDSNLNCVLSCSYLALQTTAFADLMMSQAQRIGANTTTKYYVPNSLVMNNGLDLRSPLGVTWSSSLTSVLVKQAQMADTSHPVNRVYQFLASLGFAIGILPDRGVGQNPLNYTATTFEIRNNTGKIYPHPVNSAGLDATTLQPGDMFSAVLFRAYFVPPTTGNRLSMFHFKVGGDEFVFADYKGSMIDTIAIDDTLNGKPVTIVENRNCSLLSKVYAGGVTVKADYVASDSCFIVLKI